MARAMSEVALDQRLVRPSPAPPVETRPRRLSVTEIETWLRDPYAIYARHVLKLEKLDRLDEEVGPLERGNAFHRALELFVTRHPGALPQHALEKLADLAEEVFEQEDIPAAQRAIWRPRFRSAAAWFLVQEQTRRDTVAASHLEIAGQMTLEAPAGSFLLRGKADRIDILKSGGAAILDYKTGSLPERKWMMTFLTPQLPLEAAMLEAGGFAGLPAMRAHDLIYLRLSGGARGGEERRFEGAMAADARDRLARRIAWFDEATTPYPSRVAPHSARSEGDYDHLARVREWAPAGWLEEW
jgi:ATP-dependent helicase/nuclease subunit B